MKLAPDYFSPLAMAWNIGEPPLYLGINEGCANTIPFSNKLITF